MHISPINISVHTVEPELRVKMMTNRHAGEVLKYIDEFAGAGIEMNCQLVMCRGVNDGRAPAQKPGKAGRPVPGGAQHRGRAHGLTRYRDGLYPLEPYDRESACEVLDILEEYGEKYKRQYGVRVVYPGDEWFLLAAGPSRRMNITMIMYSWRMA